MTLRKYRKYLNWNRSYKRFSKKFYDIHIKNAEFKFFSNSKIMKTKIYKLEKKISFYYQVNIL